MHLTTFYDPSSTYIFVSRLVLSNIFTSLVVIHPLPPIPPHRAFTLHRLNPTTSSSLDVSCRFSLGN